MAFTLPQPPESPNIRQIAAWINTNGGSSGGTSSAWSSITGTPTTLSGYGITDAYSKAASDGRYAMAATSLAGYGITDAYTKTASDARYLPLSGGTLTGALTGTAAVFSGDITGSDLHAYRASAPGTGAIYLGNNSGNTYLYYDGTNYQFGSGGVHVNSTLAVTSDTTLSGPLHATSADFSGVINQQGYAVPQIVVSTNAPSGTAPAYTLWLKY